MLKLNRVIEILQRETGRVFKGVGKEHDFYVFNYQGKIKAFSLNKREDLDTTCMYVSINRKDINKLLSKDIPWDNEELKLFKKKFDQV